MSAEHGCRRRGGGGGVAVPSAAAAAAAAFSAAVRWLTSTSCDFTVLEAEDIVRQTLRRGDTYDQGDLLVADAVEYLNLVCHCARAEALAAACRTLPLPNGRYQYGALLTAFYDESVRNVGGKATSEELTTAQARTMVAAQQQLHGRTMVAAQQLHDPTLTVLGPMLAAARAANPAGDAFPGSPFSGELTAGSYLDPLAMLCSYGGLTREGNLCDAGSGRGITTGMPALSQRATPTPW